MVLLFSRPGDSTVTVLERGDRRPCCAGCAGSLLRRGAEAVSYGPDGSSDHRHSPVAEHGGSCPCCARRARFPGALRAKVHAGEPLSAAEHEAWYGTSSSSTGKRRKKKKRKRRKLPKAPHPRCGASL